MNKLYIFITLIIVCIITGCELNNIPTSKVEELMLNYQMLDDSIKINYEVLSNDNNIETKYQKRYENLIEKQYKNLSYEIKEEIIDGNKATVTTEIEVLNYKKIIDKYNRNKYQKNEYHEAILENLEKTKDKITYTIDFKLIKDANDNWKIMPLDKEEEEKLLGIN